MIQFIYIYTHFIIYYVFFHSKKRKVALIFIVEEKQRHYCNPTVIWKICNDHFFKFRLSILVTMT